jgi:hypothetical protein
MFKRNRAHCYGVSRVRRLNEDQPIYQLLVWKLTGELRWKKLGWRNRQQIVKAVEEGIPYITLLPDTLWLRMVEGAPIHVVTLETGKFLRTDRHPIADDDLGNVPQQIWVAKTR